MRTHGVATHPGRLYGIVHAMLMAMLFMLVGLLLHAVGIQDSRSIPPTMNSYRYSYISLAMSP